jgi:flagellar protein FliS
MPPPPPAANAYLTTKVMTASPEELRLMLIEGAIKFARQGREGLAGGNFEAVHNGFSRCRSILLELVNSMRPEVDPELCERLSGLYMFMFRSLLEAAHERSLPKADKVIELLEYDRETWVLLMQRLSDERLAAGAIRERHLTAAAPEHPGERPGISVSG